MLYAGSSRGSVKRDALCHISDVCLLYPVCNRAPGCCCRSSLSRQCALHALIRMLDRDLEEWKKSGEKSPQNGGCFFLQVVWDVAWHSWEGEPWPWKQ